MMRVRAFCALFLLLLDMNAFVVVVEDDEEDDDAMHGH